MATLVRDYNAESLALADGASVSSWSDDAGSGIALAQGTSANQPTMATTDQKIGGLKAVHFDGTNDYLATASGSISQPLVLFVVVRATNISAQSHILAGSNHVLYVHQNRWKLFNFTPHGGGITAGAHVARVTLNGTSSKMYIDGQEHMRATSGISTNALTTFAIGANSASSPSAWAGIDVARIQIYTGMSEAEAVAQEAALMTTYGITSKAGHGSLARTETTGTSGVTSQAYTVVKPIDYSNASPKPLAIFHVGNGQNQSAVTINGEVQVVDALLARGCIVAASAMHGGDEWGNATHETDIDDLYSIVTSTLGHTVDGVIPWGTGAGAQSSLNTYRRFTLATPRAWIGVNAATNLYWASGTGTYGSQITTAYGITGSSPNTYAEKTAGRDPHLFAGSVWTNGFFWASASFSDTTHPRIQNSGPLEHIAEQNHAAEFTIYTATGSNGDITHYQYGEVYDFLGRMFAGAAAATPAVHYAREIWVPADGYGIPPRLDEIDFADPINRLSAQAEGLVSWWLPLATGGALALRDLAGPSDITTFSGGLATSQDGELGWALNGDGSDDYAALAATDRYQLQDLTISMWVYPRTQASALRTLFDYDHAASPNRNWVIQSENATTSNIWYFAYFLSDGSVQYSNTTGVTLVNNQWQHIAYRKSGTQVTAWRNGVLQGTYNATVSGTIGYASRALRLLAHVQGTGRAANALLTDVRVYNYGVPESVIGQMYDPATRWEMLRILPLWRRWVESAATSSLPIFMRYYRNRRT